MIYDAPGPDGPLDQGDLIDGCPVVRIDAFTPGRPDPIETGYEYHRVLVVTQTCDIANQKASTAIVAEVYAAQRLIDTGQLKAADIRGPIRAGRTWGVYFLPADPALGLPEMVVDLRRLHTVRLALLGELCRAGGRRGRIRPLYREHLGKHLADTNSRIGLPRPYETM